MPIIHFHKYQGTGNDFIFVDDRERIFPQDQELSSKWCDRKFGIGADGIVLIRNHEKFDFEMVYYNPDGSQSFCGNASRCAMHFANFLGLVREKADFMAIDGPHNAYVENSRIHLRLSDVDEIKRLDGSFFIDTGSPHFITFVKNLDELDVFSEGRKIRYSPPYQEKGVNVNFAEVLSNGRIFVRTYERGVENETLSCGTGVTAVALAASLTGFHSPVRIKTRGGDLEIAFHNLADDHFTDIYLIGPAIRVFTGEIEV